MAYADYEFYIKSYVCGSKGEVIDIFSFPFFERKAEICLKKYAPNLPENVPDIVRFCVCEIAEKLFFGKQDKPALGVASQSAGDVSVSYNTSASFDDLLEKEIKKTVYDYLGNSGLLYRGIIC